MEKFLVSVPDNIATRMRAAMPARQRSKVIAHLIEVEIIKRKQRLYECALAVENESALNEEMAEWDVTLKVGLKDESW